MLDTFILALGKIYGIPVVWLIMITVSNTIMIAAWYAHLKYKYLSLPQTITLSLLIAFLEYVLHVPANKFSFQYMSLPELKLMQEAIAIFIFMFFSNLFLKERLHWNHITGFCLIIASVFFIFYDFG